MFTGKEKYLSPGFILFLIILLVGMLTYQSYGVSWDEYSSQTIGLTSYHYLFNGDNSLRTFASRDYGVAFELPLKIIERLLILNDTKSIYQFRHLMTHLFFLLSAYVLFLLIDYLYKNKLLASIGFLLLILNPLIYGHSFINSKDIPFMSMHIFCYLLLALAFTKQKYSYYLLLGISCGLLTNMRIMGVLLIVSILFLFFLDMIIYRKDKITLRKIFKFSLLFLSSAILTLYASWPYLYNHPITNFVQGFINMSRYRWNGHVLFWGKEILATKLDWSYGITWFLVSNPIIYLLIGFTGMILYIFNFIKHPKTVAMNNTERNNLIYLIGFITPLIAVITLHSVLYDAWRQLYFIYPAFLLIGIYGIHQLFKTMAKKAMVIILFTSFLFVGYYMVSNFPYEHIYFNQFVNNNEPEKLRKTFDLDYWGTSYQQGIEYILNSDTSSIINISFNPPPPRVDLLIFNPKDQHRINSIADINEADYLVTNYRDHPQDFPYSESKECYTIKVMNNRILSVFKLK